MLLAIKVAYLPSVFGFFFFFRHKHYLIDNIILWSSLKMRSEETILPASVISGDT